MYMYPIIINREAKMVSYEKSFKLNDLKLSFTELTEYVNKDESFYIDNDEMKIYVYGKRLETSAELSTRVKQEEDYMKRYTDFQNRNKELSKI